MWDSRLESAETPFHIPFAGASSPSRLGCDVIGHDPLQRPSLIARHHFDALNCDRAVLSLVGCVPFSLVLHPLCCRRFTTTTTHYLYHVHALPQNRDTALYKLPDVNGNVAGMKVPLSCAFPFCPPSPAYLAPTAPPPTTVLDDTWRAWRINR